MIANEKPELLEASEALYKYNNEDTIRFQCYAREDYRRKMNRIERDQKRLAELEIQNEELTFQNNELANQNNELVTQNAALLAEIERLKAQQ